MPRAFFHFCIICNLTFFEFIVVFSSLFHLFMLLLIYHRFKIMNNAHKMICWLILLNVCDLDAKWKAQAQFDTAESLAQCTTAQNNKKKTMDLLNLFSYNLFFSLLRTVSPCICYWDWVFQRGKLVDSLNRTKILTSTAHLFICFVSATWPKLDLCEFLFFHSFHY